MVDIFQTKEKVMPEWMKFVNAGDAIQGTYVGKIVGQIDGYGNEQVIYQLLKDDKIVNVGFGLNKKFLNKDMESVKFGQIIGFKYKGKVEVKDKFGKAVMVKDFSLHQDPKIVDEAWLKANPNGVEVQVADKTSVSEKPKGFGDFDNVVATNTEDVPFSSAGSLTNADKLTVIEKLAKDKLGVIGSQAVKDKVMEVTGIAFIPVNFDKITEKLISM
jgi:hypothetical protein